jgi:hypothetical protein
MLLSVALYAGVLAWARQPALIGPAAEPAQPN